MISSTNPDPNKIVIGQGEPDSRLLLAHWDASKNPVSAAPKPQSFHTDNRVQCAAPEGSKTPSSFKSLRFRSALTISKGAVPSRATACLWAANGNQTEGIASSSVGAAIWALC